MQATYVTKENGGLRVVAYSGDNAVLLAMSLDDNAVNDTDKNLAGFAIWRKPAGKPETALGNRLSFDIAVTAGTTPDQRKWTPSPQAPFQKFRWIDVPPDGFDDTIAYRVKALYFAGAGAAMKDGPEVTIAVPPIVNAHRKLHVAFPRGYIASQAYADRFGNKPIRPDGPKTPDFDTKPYQAQYQWLGADARKRLFDFLDDCAADRSAKIDFFGYDLDEPDVIAAICGIGRQGRLRAILDNAQLHTKPDKQGNFPPEVKAAQMIIAAAGGANVKQGHFARFQHNKVIIKRDAQGNAQRVLFGSMNFSVRGLYVQANNIVIVDDPAFASLFGQAFDVAFEGNVQVASFAKNPISSSYKVGSAADNADLPKFSIAFSPHSDSQISLKPVSDRIRGAASSVLFAVMEPTGGGPVLASLRTIAATPSVFSYGTVQTDKGLHVQTPEGAMGEVTSFDYLKSKVPAPFAQEWNGGPGIAIHDKFVVVDFNGDNPTVFAGSSNLAAGGEKANGDNLAMIEDPGIASQYAIEAVRLFDHYHFRSNMSQATEAAPLMLWYPDMPNAGAPWWKGYYDNTDIKLRDRCLFANVPLPAGVATRKDVDWTAVDAAADAPGKPGNAKTTPSAAAKGVKSKRKSKPKAKKPTAKKTKTKKPKTQKPKTKKSKTKKSKAKSKTKKSKKPRGATKKSTSKRRAAKKKRAPASHPLKRAAAGRRIPKKRTAVRKQQR